MPKHLLSSSPESRRADSALRGMSSKSKKNKQNRVKTPLYKSPAASAESRVKDLLARMTLEEKAAQMMCVWQEKSQSWWTPKATLTLQSPRPPSKKGMVLGRLAVRATPAGRRPRRSRAQRAADGRAHQCRPEIFPRRIAAGHSRHFPRGMFARSRGQGRHQLSATHRSGSDLQSRAGRIALCDGGL